MKKSSDAEVDKKESEDQDDRRHLQNSTTRLLRRKGADCGVAVEGCIWCAEPVYGLCVTESAAKRMNIMPFFT